jgi:hypothetical protein
MGSLPAVRFGIFSGSVVLLAAGPVHFVAAPELAVERYTKRPACLFACPLPPVSIAVCIPVQKEGGCNNTAFSGACSGL